MPNKFEKCKSLLSRYCHDTSGATALEYALLVAMLSIAMIGASQYIVSSQSNSFNKIANGLK
ncbi:MAG: Flp family type IVb pilin [Robiginitomaculum sp.]|nr:MAG: Flp family type IVb pilin [Robiginitomaculum sp.]